MPDNRIKYEPDDPNKPRNMGFYGTPEQKEIAYSLKSLSKDAIQAIKRTIEEYHRLQENNQP